MKNTFLVQLVFIIAVCFIVIAGIFVFSFYNKNDTINKITNTPQNKKLSWVKIASKYSSEFYNTEEAVRIGNNILLFQSEYGGWNKNINLQVNLNLFDKIYIFYDKSLKNNPTIDNKATVTEIDYLSKLYNTTHDYRYKKAVLKGINYLLKMQMENGGFPQSFPNTLPAYKKHITYNDKAMVNVLELFYEIVNNYKQYDFIETEVKNKLNEAFDKGIDCILKTQLSDGAWGAQYDYKTLKPASARIYEPAAIDARETANITLFLMKIKNNSPDIITSIKKAVIWLEKYKITNQQIAEYINTDGIKDIRIAECNNCPPMWTRMYDLDSYSPIFSDRSGKIYSNIDDISYERRNNYEWYVYDGNQVLKQYQIWKNQFK